MSTTPTLFAAMFALQIAAVRFPRIWLKVLASIAGVYTLIHFVHNKPEGTYMDIWVFGMNLWCIVLKAFNIHWFRLPATLSRCCERDNGAELRSLKLNRPPSTSTGSAVDRANSMMGVVRREGKRLLDNVEMIVTLRAVGWKFEAKGLPPAPPMTTSRAAFVMGQVLAVFWRYLVIDAGRALINATSLGRFPLRTAPIELPLSAKLGLGIYTCLYCRWTLDVPYRALSVVSVSLGFSKPHEWPPLMGDWKEAWTVRRFWTHTWHQMMRLQAEPPVHFLVHDVLQIDKGHYLSRWGKVFGNFAVAAGMHAYGRVLAHGVARYDWDMFMAHALGIWVEDHVQSIVFVCGLSTRGSKSSKALGFVWTGLFVSWTWHYFMEEMVRAGGVVMPAFGISPVDSITGFSPSVRGNQLLLR